MATAARPLAVARNRRVVIVVAVAAAVAAASVVGLTLLQTRGQTTTVPGSVTAPQPGRPPLELELGLRSDAEARALARAQGLLDQMHPKPAQAAAIFRRYHSLEGQLGLAFATWRGPASLAAVKKLVAAHPNDPAALLNLGWADYQAGRNADAAAAWRETAARYPDSPYGVDAEDALHGGPRGLPPIVTALALPKALADLPAATQAAALERAASGSNVGAKLLYGTALWNYLRKPVSAERQFAAAARLAPHDPVARTLAAVGLFSKANPRRAFARLGPLTAVFPHSPVVEFHLGVLLLYIGQNAKAEEQLRAAVADGRGTPYATQARPLLASLAHPRSK